MRRLVPLVRVRNLGLVALLLTTGAGPAFATGFFINQQSVRGLGRVDAGNTVAADELGTIFFNPAGLPCVMQRSNERHSLAVEVHEIMPRNSERNRGSSVATPGTLGTPVPVGGGDARNSVGPTPVPVVYYARALAGGRGAIGAGVNAPFGLTMAFDRSWNGRYDAVEASLKTYNASGVVAYGFGRIQAPSGEPSWKDACRSPAGRQPERGSPRLLVGGGVDVQRATTSLVAAIPNPLTPGGPTVATDATIRNEGAATSAGFNVGVLWNSTLTTRVGVHYRSRMTHHATGTARFTGLPGPLAALNGVIDARATLNLPDILSFGGSWHAWPRLIVLGDVKWFNWSRFDEVRIAFADGRPDTVRPYHFRDAWAMAIGVESPATERLSVRGGAHIDTTPTVDEFRDTALPDSPRLWLGAGTTYQISSCCSVDIAFTHARSRPTTVDLTRTFFDATPLATAVRIHDDVRSIASTIAAGLRWKF